MRSDPFVTMRIAIVAPVFAPLLEGQSYGPQAFLVDLGRSLASRGHEVVVYCAAGSRMPGLALRQVSVSPLVAAARVVPQRRPLGSPQSEATGSSVSRDVASALEQAFETVYGAIDEDGAQVISQHAFDAAAIELAGTRPILHTLHLPPIVPAMVSAAGASRAPLAVVSEAARLDWQSAGVRAEHVLRNGVRSWDPGHVEVEPVALIAGRISPEKGTAVAIRAALRAGLRPCVVGEVYDTQYYEAEVAPLVDLIDLRAPVRREALWRLMARAAVTLMPVAWEEPFGLVAAEAQMAGCPVVGYRRGALPEVVEEGVGGLLVQPDDEDGLVAAVAVARSLPRDRVRDSAHRRLGIEPAVDAYERVLRRIAAQAEATSASPVG